MDIAGPIADNSRARHLLLVDDDPDFCEILQEVLEDRGFEVDVAHNGAAALELMDNRDDSGGYSVLISDVNMPGMSGIELIRHTRSRYPLIVPVIVTGFPDTKAAVEALRAGAYDFISKPVKLDTIYLVIGRALEKHDFLVERMQYEQKLEQEIERRTHELRRLNRNLINLNQLAVQTRETLDMDEKIDRFRDYCMTSMGVRRFSFMPFDASTASFVPVNQYAVPDAPFPTPIPVNRVEVRGDGVVDGLPAPTPGDVGCFVRVLRRKTVLGLVYLGFDEPEAMKMDQVTLALLLSELEIELAHHLMVKQHENELREMFMSSIRTHAHTIEAKDPYTKGHCERVEQYCMIMGRRLIPDEEKRFPLSVACILHDIGKIGVPEGILNKPGSLSAEESEVMKRHPVIGGEIVRQLVGFDLEPIIRHHHEWFDGSGYPDGLKGEEIPLESRIIAVADTYDAMTSSRPYRDGMTPHRARDEILAYSGRQFDPNVVQVFCDSFEEIMAVDSGSGLQHHTVMVRYHHIEQGKE